jgi:hypothetical protein
MIMLRSDLETLDFYALSVMDNGIPNQLLRNALRRVGFDLVDRKGDATARVITIKLTLKPTLDPGGNMSHVKAAVQIKDKVPEHITETYQLAVDAKDGLFVNLEFPKQLDQRSLFHDLPDGVEHKEEK